MLLIALKSAEKVVSSVTIAKRIHLPTKQSQECVKLIEKIPTLLLCGRSCEVKWERGLPSLNLALIIKVFIILLLKGLPGAPILMNLLLSWFFTSMKRLYGPLRNVMQVSEVKM